MRAKEFISEDRQKLDEIAPLACRFWAATAGTCCRRNAQYLRRLQIGKTLKHTVKPWITGAELTRRGVSDAAIAALGGAVGKGLLSKAGSCQKLE
jgi:hypothetical protein